MSMQHYFGDDENPQRTKAPPDAVPTIQEITIALRVVARLVDELPGGARTTRLSVAVETAQAAAAAHGQS